MEFGSKQGPPNKLDKEVEKKLRGHSINNGG